MRRIVQRMDLDIETGKYLFNKISDGQGVVGGELFSRLLA